jgi:hypothetical protein
MRHFSPSELNKFKVQRFRAVCNRVEKACDEPPISYKELVNLHYEDNDRVGYMFGRGHLKDLDKQFYGLQLKLTHRGYKVLDISYSDEEFAVDVTYACSVTGKDFWVFTADELIAYYNQHVNSGKKKGQEVEKD